MKIVIPEGNHCIYCHFLCMGDRDDTCLLFLKDLEHSEDTKKCQQCLDKTNITIEYAGES